MHILLFILLINLFFICLGFHPPAVCLTTGYMLLILSFAFTALDLFIITILTFFIRKHRFTQNNEVVNEQKTALFMRKYALICLACGLWNITAVLIWIHAEIINTQMLIGIIMYTLGALIFDFFFSSYEKNRQQSFPDMPVQLQTANPPSTPSSP